MDNALPDVSARGELDSATSTDSPRSLADEYHPRYQSTAAVVDAEPSRHAILELENERMRVELENARIDLNARVAANRGLRGKVAELFVEMQAALRDKQRLQNTLADTSNRLSIAETSAKWYQSQMHTLTAGKKSLQAEIDTYQGILRQRQRAIADINASYKKLSGEYTELAQQYQREKREMQDTMRDLRSRVWSVSAARDTLDRDSTASPTDTPVALEATEDELRNARAELKALEQRLLGDETARTSMESTLSVQRALISSMEENARRSEAEKNEAADLLRRTQLETQKLRYENETLQTSLLASEREQGQVRNAISRLRPPLTRLIAQYRLLKSKNAEFEKKLSTVRDLANDNERSRASSCKANGALLKKLREEKAKVKDLEQKFCCKRTNDQLGIMDLQDQLKSITRIADESIDEGYGDSNSTNASSISLDIPSPTPVNSVLLNNIVDVLARSKNFGSSMQEELNVLRSKMETLRDQCDMWNQQIDYFSINDTAPPRNPI